jgi:hypothetical protein
MQSVRIGWGVTTDWEAVFDPHWYAVGGEQLAKAFRGDVFAFSELAVPATLAHFAGSAALEAWARGGGRTRWRRRLPLYLGAWAMFHLSVCGRSSLLMMGMIRYALPVHALLVLATADCLSEVRVRIPRPARQALWALLGALLLASFLAQRVLATEYMHWRWAA